MPIGLLLGAPSVAPRAAGDRLAGTRAARGEEGLLPFSAWSTATDSVTHSIYIGRYRDWETGSPIRNVIGNDIAVGVDGLGFGNGIGSEVRVVDLE